MTDNNFQNKATEKQRSFIRALWNKHNVLKLEDKGSWADQYRTNTLTTETASRLIDLLLALPKRSEPQKSGVEEALDRIPKSFYAIPADMVENYLPDIDLYGNDLLFIEVKMLPKSYRRPQGLKVMRRLHGHPGGFSRSIISDKNVTALVKQIETDPVKFSRLFGEHYGVCGRCAANLTDHVSRRTQFGPECRKVYGIIG